MSELAGINFNQYGTWEKLQAPTGQIYYKIPGTGYVYDPFLSQAKGRPIIWTNPSSSYEEKRKAQKQAEQAASPLGQILPVAGTVAGTVGANYLIDALKPATAQDKLFSAMADKVAGQTAAAPATAGEAFMGPLMQDGSVAPPVEGLGVTPYLGAAQAALGAYGLYDTLSNPEGKRKGALSGGLSGASLGAGLGMAAPLLGLGPLGWGGLALSALAGGGAGALLGSAFGSKSTKQTQGERWESLGKEAPQMVDYFAGTGGEKSRDESLLTPDAIRVNPDNYNNIPDWDSWDKGMQDRFLSQMLAEKKVSERKGGIYYDDERAKEIAAEIRMGKELANRANSKGK